MTDPLPIEPASRPIDAVVRVPGSKSITNRALILASLASGRSRLEGALHSEDTLLLASALRQLGIPVQEDAAGEAFEVEGQGGRIPASKADLFAGNSGTSIRFLAALVTLGSGRYRLDGVERMRQRPIQDLLDALNRLGVAAWSESGSGCPPVVVAPDGPGMRETVVRGSVSSQFVSALLMIGPARPEGLRLAVEGDLVSRPYVEMTLRMMEQWGARFDRRDCEWFDIPGGQWYRSRTYRVEPDSSSASYFLAAAAVTGGRVRIQGIGRHSLQGDSAFAAVLARMGCRVEQGPDVTEVRGPDRLRGIDVDMNAIPDCAMTLAAIAPFADGPTVIRGIGNIRFKETDRLQALAAELSRIGCRVETTADTLAVFPPSDIQPADVETYEDHRMAMSFAVTGLRAPGIRIKNPGCVAKTFPGFFEQLRAALK